MQCETVKVQRGDSCVTINKSDFVDGIDKLFKEKQTKPKKAK
jgi:hypothetical protein